MRLMSCALFDVCAVKMHTRSIIFHCALKIYMFALLHCILFRLCIEETTNNKVGYFQIELHSRSSVGIGPITQRVCIALHCLQDTSYFDVAWYRCSFFRLHAGIELFCCAFKRYTVCLFHCTA
jgi:hypothetical protein